MPKTRYPFTNEAAQQIVAYVRQGAYELQAAEAAGIPKEVYRQWIEWGTPAKGRRLNEPYATFVDQVRQAKAQARILAEIEVRVNDPRFWLTRGPGREQPGSPGWSKETKPVVIQDNRSLNLLASPEWNSLWTTILQH